MEQMKTYRADISGSVFVINRFLLLFPWNRRRLVTVHEKLLINLKS